MTTRNTYLAKVCLWWKKKKKVKAITTFRKMTSWQKSNITVMRILDLSTLGCGCNLNNLNKNVTESFYAKLWSVMLKYPRHILTIFWQADMHFCMLAKIWGKKATAVSWNSVFIFVWSAHMLWANFLHLFCQIQSPTIVTCYLNQHNSASQYNMALYD